MPEPSIIKNCSFSKSKVCSLLGFYLSPFWQPLSNRWCIESGNQRRFTKRWLEKNQKMMVNHFRTSNWGNIASLTPEETEEGEFVVGPRWNSPTFKTMAGQGESGRIKILVFLSSADSFIGGRTPREVWGPGSIEVSFLGHRAGQRRGGNCLGRANGKHSTVSL